MVVTENLTINRKAFVRTYSDSGRMVERDGVLYEEAVDLAQLDHIYVESDIPMPELTDAQVLEILLGGGL